MKLLTLAPYFPSPVGPSHGLFILDQLLALRDSGVESENIAATPWAPQLLAGVSDRFKSLTETPDRESVAGLAVTHQRYLKAPGRHLAATAGLSLAASLARRLNHFDDIDVIHAHGALPCGHAAYALSKLLGVPFVMTIHGEPAQALLAGRFANLAYRGALKNAFRVVLVGEPLRGHVLSLGVPKQNIVVVHNGVRRSDVATTPKARSRDLQSAFLLLSVSNLADNKGIVDNLRAMRMLLDKGHDNVRYVVIGEGSQLPELKELTSKLGLATHVRFLGQLGHDEAMRWMASCDVFSLPSWRESFGLVYLEAMLHGRPVIGISGQGPSQFVEHGKTGFLVEAHQPSQIADGISDLFATPARAQAIGDAGKNAAWSERWSWSRNAVEMAEIFQSAFEHSAASGPRSVSDLGQSGG